MLWCLWMDVPLVIDLCYLMIMMGYAPQVVLFMLHGRHMFDEDGITYMP